MKQLKWIFFSALIFSRVVEAYCPAENEHVSFRGVLKQKIYAGPPNFESIEQGDEALSYSVLELERPLSCTLDNEALTVNDVQIVSLEKSKLTYAALSRLREKTLIVAGEAMYAQNGRHATPILVLLDDVGVVNPIKTAAQKKEALQQFQHFQRAVREKNVAELKAFFVFPFDGQVFDFTAYDESIKYPDNITGEIFDRYSESILEGLQPLGDIRVDVNRLAIDEHRVNALSEEEQKRQYHPSGKEGSFYYVEHGQRHEMGAVCDKVFSGNFDENSLIMVSEGAENSQLQEGMESCEYGSGYIFNLVDGKLRLVSSYSAG